LPLRDYEASPLTALDREVILAELEELGVSPRHLRGGDGAALMTRLRSLRAQSERTAQQFVVEFAVFRPHP
jgi:hypothetical protein